MAVLTQAPNSSPPPGAPPLWGTHRGVASGGGAGGGSLLPGGGHALEPLSQRLLRLAALLSVLLIAVLANYFLNSGEDPLNPVAVAAERAQRCPGARFSLYIVYSSPAASRSIAASGGGAYNARTERSRASLELNSPMTGPVHIVSIGDGKWEYTSGDTVADQLPPGKKWVRTKSGAQDSETPLDMEDSLRMLSSSGGVQLIGHESINGKMTRRYRGEIDLGSFVDFLREEGKGGIADAYERIEGVAATGISAEAWVDRRNLLRRFRMVMPMPGHPGQPPLTVDMRMDLFDYGAHPRIQLPDPGRVIDGPAGGGEETASFS